jgi:hypothetical protein
MNINKDLHNNVKQMLALSPVARGATGSSAGKIIDRQGYGGVEFLIGYGAVTTTGSVVTPIMKEGDVTGTLTSVADADMLGTEALAGLAAGTPRTSGVSQQVVKRVGYKGTKRYVQLTLVNTGTTSAGLMWADALLFNAGTMPISNP